MIFERILQIAPSGTVIPKPEAKGEFRIKRLGTRRGERALIYTIPNHKNPEKPYEKGITASEFEIAYEELVASGEFTRQWFKRHLPKCEAEGTCNFTTIGGLFVLLGEAAYERQGVYRRVLRNK